MGLEAPAKSEDQQTAVKQVAGWVERIKLYPGKLDLRAKLDTGAKTSSLNATQIHEFERQGHKWVRFDVVNNRGKKITLEKPVHRVVRIKRHTTKPQMRPVIRIDICLGSVYKEAEVNLVNRSNFNYQMLIGRNFLKDAFIVDPAVTFITKPGCQGVKDP